MIDRITRTAALLLLVAAMGAACASINEIRELPGRITRLEARVRAIEDTLEKLETQVDALSDTSGKRIAGTAADLESLAAQLQDLRGLLDDLDYRLSQVGTSGGDLGSRIESIERRIANLETLVGSGSNNGETPDEPPTNGGSSATDRQTEYRQAYNLYDAGRLDEARIAFQEFLNKYPEGDLADNALFWIGECYFRQGDYVNAARHYGRIIKEFPKSSKIPDAYYKLGIAFYNLQKYEAARAAFQKVLDDFPQSYAAPLARKKLELIKKEGH